ncbi:MAG: HD domain-containing protein [Deltaproteobacteria bacterium]|nr:MAG: HD domain-containing protein [Deltaproteobacteria bacterium]
MDEYLLRSLIRKGFSLTHSTATAAGYSIVSADRLALDNLSARLSEQEEVLYLATVDDSGTVVSHSDLSLMGTKYEEREGKVLEVKEDGSSVRVVETPKGKVFEFRTPIVFAGKILGKVYLGIDASILENLKVGARWKIGAFSAGVTVVGVLLAFFLSAFVTTPIRNLQEGVSLLKDGKLSGELRIYSRDEIGELTKSFNEMARVITEQKEKLGRYTKELEDAYVSTVRILAAAIDARDEYTFGHSTRVARISVLIGERLGLGEEQLRDLEMACLFHDVGKIRTPDRILHKQDRLNEEEFEIMMRHPGDGAEILSLSDQLKKHIPAVLYHHEWYNGSGYPSGLAGDSIPLFAAIIAIADAFDAMTTRRPYRDGLSRSEALEEIKRYRGIQFHPEITDVFVELVESGDLDRAMAGTPAGERKEA